MRIKIGALRELARPGPGFLFMSQNDAVLLWVYRAELYRVGRHFYFLLY